MLGPFPAWVRRCASPGADLADIPARQLLVDAINQQDDTYALHLIKGGHIDVHHRIRVGHGNYPLGYEWIANMPLLFFAIYRMRGDVVKALVEAGADVNVLVQQTIHSPYLAQGKINAAGICVFFDISEMLVVVHRLGAKLGPVFQDYLMPVPYNALQWAVQYQATGCVEYILKELYHGKLIGGDPFLASIVVIRALTGDVILEIYKLLHYSGSFDFKSLESIDYCAFEDPHQTSNSTRAKKSAQEKSRGKVTAADQILTNAVNGKAAALVKFLVKDVGLVARAENMKMARALTMTKATERGFADDLDLMAGISHEAVRVESESFRQYPDMARFLCVACAAVAATKLCTRCRKARYCSSDCQRTHWPAHKKECKKLRNNPA